MADKGEDMDEITTVSMKRRTRARLETLRPFETMSTDEEINWILDIFEKYGPKRARKNGA